MNDIRAYLVPLFENTENTMRLVFSVFSRTRKTRNQTCSVFYLLSLFFQNKKQF